MIEFFVEGHPKGQPRPRAFARKIGDRVIARVYDAGTAEGWKSQVAIAARDHRPAAPLEGPLHLVLLFYFPRPKSHFRKVGLREDAPHWHTSKPDFDNAAKAVVDAMTTLGFWRDDAQIAYGQVFKLYCQKTGCQVILKPLEKEKVVTNETLMSLF